MKKILFIVFVSATIIFGALQLTVHFSTDAYAAQGIWKPCPFGGHCHPETGAGTCASPCECGGPGDSKMCGWDGE
jgi:hypothetical protein